MKTNSKQSEAGGLFCKFLGVNHYRPFSNIVPVGLVMAILFVGTAWSMGQSQVTRVVGAVEAAKAAETAIKAAQVVKAAQAIAAINAAAVETQAGKVKVVGTVPAQNVLEDFSGEALGDDSITAESMDAAKRPFSLLWPPQMTITSIISNAPPPSIDIIFNEIDRHFEPLRKIAAALKGDHDLRDIVQDLGKAIDDAKQQLALERAKLALERAKRPSNLP